MSEEQIRKTFSKNLRKYLERDGKQPADLVRDLGIPFSTVSNWINGIKLPRMGKVELLAQYFGIEKSDLLEEKQDSTGYYYDPETAALAQELYDNKELGLLMSASRKMSPEALRNLTALVESMIKDEKDNGRS